MSNNIPAEMIRLKQWVKLPPGRKFPTEPGWQKNPKNYNDIQEPNGRGFLLSGTPYMCIDGDHVVKEGQYIDDWAGQFFDRLISTATYVEYSMSGTGLHVFFRLDKEWTYGGLLDKLKYMSANGGQYNYWLPGFEEEPKDTRPHIEIFFNAGRQIFLTGKAIAGDTIEQAPSMLNELLAKMPAFIVPEGQQTPGLAQSRELPSSCEVERAAAMLNCIDPAGLDYHDWVKVGQILHDLGADVSLWDEWSQRDPGRYKGSREITSKWASFRGKGGGATIATLHTMAKAGGYEEKTFQRDWFSEHPDNQPQQVTIKQVEPVNIWATNPFDGFLDRIQGGEYKAVKTNIPKLDELMGGGFVPGKLTLLGAAPGKAKTAICQWIAETMAGHNKDFKAVFISLEMDRDDLLARSLARVIHENGLGDLSTFDVLQGNDIPAISAGIDKYLSLYGKRIQYNPGIGGEVSHSRNLADVLKTVDKAGDIDMLVIDYIQLLRAANCNTEMEHINNSLVALLNLAKTKHCIVIAVMANNRSSNISGSAEMFTGRGSGDLEYAGDFVLNITDEDINGAKTGRRYLTVAKGRLAQVGRKLAFTFDGRHMLPKDFEFLLGTIENQQQQKINNDLAM